MYFGLGIFNKMKHISLDDVLSFSYIGEHKMLMTIFWNKILNVLLNICIWLKRYLVNKNKLNLKNIILEKYTDMIQKFKSI